MFKKLIINKQLKNVSIQKYDSKHPFPVSLTPKILTFYDLQGKLEFLNK